tara:strand:+ start:387 stop:524 length:138 start_codon:yes stop_codon:yes gene_type:complete
LYRLIDRKFSFKKQKEKKNKKLILKKKKEKRNEQKYIFQQYSTIT